MRVRKRRYRGWFAWSFSPQKCREILSAFKPECLYKVEFIFYSHSVCFRTTTPLRIRTDQKRPDGLTLVPWAVGKPLLWDVTVVYSLAPCRINAGSICNPGTAAAETEKRKNDKYKDLIDDGYLFQPPAFEIQVATGPSTEIFLKRTVTFVYCSHT